MIILGLTGSIGMGKTTVANQFAEAGAAITNADAFVHELLQQDKQVIAAIADAFPQAVEEGQVNRQALGDAVFGQPDKVQKLEAILHPRVRSKEVAAILQAQNNGQWLMVLDIPLLYETGADSRCHKVAVVTADESVQRQRVMQRNGMTEEKFRAILSRQLPDADKQHRADYIIRTDNGLDDSAAQVRRIMTELEGLRHA